MEPMILGGNLSDLAPDDLRFVLDLGLVRAAGDGSIEVSNPIYREIIVRSLTVATRAPIPKLKPTWLSDKQSDPADAGLDQLDEYLAGLDVTRGWLVRFDQRKAIGSLADRTKVETVTSPRGNSVTRLLL